MTHLFSIELRLPQQNQTHHPTKLISNQLKLNQIRHLIQTTCNPPSSESRIISLNSDQIEHEHEHEAILSNQTQSIQSSQIDSTLSLEPIHDLGEGALEYCIPPPYRTPQRALDDDDEKQLLLKHSNPSSPTMKPWSNYQPLPCTDQAFSYDLRSTFPISHSHSRGFWLIPVWKTDFKSTDLYSIYHPLISLPYWSDLRLLKIDQNLKKLDLKRIIWNPFRLKLFWKIMETICERRELGNVVALAMVASHLHSIEARISNSSFQKGEDGLGDHLRIWCDVRSALLVRRFISEISLKKAKEIGRLNGLNKADQDWLDQTDDEKWLENCVLMWFDQTGIPRGYS
ncbi:hypothetical protein DFH28DRAFT_1082123 [Melampsora americana]|nr:hypothetical protein DFH28DRAFT_1082123 [Melampsora americana]